MKKNISIAAFFISSLISIHSYSSDKMNASSSNNSNTKDVSVNQSKIDMFASWSTSQDTLLLLTKINSWQADSLKKYYEDYSKIALNNDDVANIMLHIKQFQNNFNQASEKKFIGKY